MSSRLIHRFPELYFETQEGRPFSRRSFFGWMAAAVFHSATAFFFTILSLNDLTGHADGHQVCVVYVCVFSLVWVCVGVWVIAYR